MASLDFDQKFVGRIARQTADANPFLSGALYQILGLSVLLARRLIRARKLRKLDTSRDTPSLAAYQHILWISREGLSILELYVLPYAQDNQHGPECRVLSVKLRASFYHIFCLFHNHPPVTTTNMAAADSQAPPPSWNSNRKSDPPALSPSSKRAGKQPILRDPVDSIVSETSFVTNPYAAGGPIGTPSPGPPLHAPPGLNPIPIPQPSSFILPPLNFIPLATGYFSTATSYATQFLPGSHPLRLSVALEHSAFLWDCVHDHDASRRIARRAIKDVYRAQEAMDDSEFEDAAELVGILGRMMKRKSWEETPRVGGAASPEPVSQGASHMSKDSNGGSNRAPPAAAQPSPQSKRKPAGRPFIPEPSVQTPTRNAARSRSGSDSKAASGERKGENTPRSDTQRRAESGSGSGSQDTTPRARQVSIESGASTTPRAVPQATSTHSPATPLTVRSSHKSSGSNGSQTRTPAAGEFALVASPPATVRKSPTLRRSPPIRSSPTQQSTYMREQR